MLWYAVDFHGREVAVAAPAMCGLVDMRDGYKYYCMLRYSLSDIINRQLAIIFGVPTLSLQRRHQKLQKTLVEPSTLYDTRQHRLRTTTRSK